jgi:hypothetical protein
MCASIRWSIRNCPVNWSCHLDAIPRILSHRRVCLSYLTWSPWQGQFDITLSMQLRIPSREFWILVSLSLKGEENKFKNLWLRVRDVATVVLFPLTEFCPSILCGSIYRLQVVRLRWSGTQYRGFAPDRSRRIFSVEKIYSMPSFRGEVK